VENHARLLGSFKENEDTLYRLAQNPERRSHRGTSWCRPNMAPSGPYASPRSLAAMHSGHGLGMNFEAASETGVRARSDTPRPPRTPHQTPNELRGFTVGTAAAPGGAASISSLHDGPRPSRLRRVEPR
jgi:hypothetical protein